LTRKTPGECYRRRHLLLAVRPQHPERSSRRAALLDRAMMMLSGLMMMTSASSSAIGELKWQDYLSIGVVLVC